MLRLKDITKNYKVAGGEIEVLKGLNVCFRKNEFVSILGPSGCGKTTTLNIVGGLDKYTDGDLIIQGRSTKNFKDHDWDVYRNQRIGFIFQSYNLIPHQTVLGNVELSLTISGVSKEERIRRSLKALERVGLKGEEYKRPNQLSGGQCQRVAIARALVNEPDILLADEPTGALDSKTSVQIMDLIKEIANDRLVIMVTHNAELAEEYSNRIIRLVDGEIVEDTNPYSAEDEQKEVEEIKKEIEDIKDYSEWLRVQYGDYFAENFPFKYTRKYWGVEPKDLETKWVGNRMHSPDLDQVLKGAFETQEKNFYYTSHMKYPKKGGFRSILNTCREGLDIKFNKEVIKIDIENKNIIFNDGSNASYSRLISSLPLPEIIKMLENVPENVKKEIKLIYRDLEKIDYKYVRLMQEK